MGAMSFRRSPLSSPAPGVRGLDESGTRGVRWSERADFVHERVVEEGTDGVPRYRPRSKRLLRPPSELIAVCIPGSDISRSWTNAAREVVSRNELVPDGRPLGRELVGFLRCVVCNTTMRCRHATRGHDGSTTFYYQ